MTKAPFKILGWWRGIRWRPCYAVSTAVSVGWALPILDTVCPFRVYRIMLYVCARKDP